MKKIIELFEKTVIEGRFINGCYLFHLAHYRVTHQREQLDVAEISNSEIFYKNILWA